MDGASEGEGPGLVPMSDAGRAAAVSVLAEILAAWWMKRASDGQVGARPGTCPHPGRRRPDLLVRLRATGN